MNHVSHPFIDLDPARRLERTEMTENAGWPACPAHRLK